MFFDLGFSFIHSISVCQFTSNDYEIKSPPVKAFLRVEFRIYCPLEKPWMGNSLYEQLIHYLLKSWQHIENFQYVYWSEEKDKIYHTVLKYGTIR
jgi:hypothetical protein